MDSTKYSSSALNISVALYGQCVIYGFMVNNSLVLFPLSDWFVTPSHEEWHYSCSGGGTAINVMSQAVNVIPLQTQRGSLNLSSRRRQETSVPYITTTGRVIADLFCP